MPGRYLAIGLTLSLAYSQTLTALPTLQASEKEAAETQKIKERAARYDIGKKVKLKLRDDKKETKGTITALDDDGLTIKIKDSSQALTTPYAQVKSLKEDGPPVVKYAIAAAATAVGVFLGYAFWRRCRNEGAC
jgi:RimP-like protein